MDRYDEQARAIWDKVNGRGGGTKEAIAAYASALRAAATVQEGCVMLPGGRTVKVLGTLPMTADGCVIGIGAMMFMRRSERRNSAIDELPPALSPCGHDGDPYECPHFEFELGQCYSTHEAAEYASKAVQPRVITIDEAKPTVENMELAMGQVDEKEVRDNAPIIVTRNATPDEIESQRRGMLNYKPGERQAIVEKGGAA